MTDSPAPMLEMIKIEYICAKCHETKTAWLTQKEFESMRFEGIYYGRTCATCKNPSTVAAAAPIKAQRVADPERTQHSRRHSSGFHKAAWRVTQ